MTHQQLTSDQLQQLAKIRHLALDMDGTIYSGKTLFDFTLTALETFRQLGIGYTFLTNNSSRSVTDYLAKIRAYGIDAAPDNIYTSSLATIEYIKDNFSSAHRIFILGTQSLKNEFTKAGFEVVTEFDTPEPDIVVVGFDTELTYLRLCKAAWWIDQGKPYIATHPDRICPTDQELVLVDCGAVCQCIESATSRRPDIVLGKPEPVMVHGILRRHNLQPSQLAIVGDRLYTDMAMALNTGALGILVLTGETRPEDLNENNDQILVFPDILCFASEIVKVRNNTSGI